MQKIPEYSIMTLTDICERWGISPAKVYKLEDEGKLRRLPIGAYYSTANVLRLEDVDDDEGVNLFDYYKIKRELEKEKEENKMLQARLRDINRLSLGGEPLEFKVSEG